MKRRSFLTFAAVIGIVAILIAMGRAMWLQQQWFELQQQQLGAIEKIAAYPPPGWEQAAWNNALITPYNVWGNVTYSPNYSKISNSEMQELRRQLEQIAAETNHSNSIESVDRVFELLLKRGQKIKFITEYRKEFKTYDAQVNNAPADE